MQNFNNRFLHVNLCVCVYKYKICIDCVNCMATIYAPQKIILCKARKNE